MKNLVNLAKGKTEVKKTEVKKTATKTVAVKKEIQKSPEEIRDLKAKEAVENLLKDVEIIPQKDNNIIVADSKIEIAPTETKLGMTGKEWLSEQVGLLGEEVERLQRELQISKDDYSRLFQQFENKGGGNLSDGTTNQNILLMFTELQANFTGNNAERYAHDIVKIEYLLNQMLLYFPFLNKYKRFQ